MIESISINNYALIDKTEIELERGFSVITGETGAGKSILLGALGLTLGQRAEASVIMDKEKKCVVEIVYQVGGYTLKEWFDENELDYSDRVVVRREVFADGKSRCFINDTPVNNKLLKEFGGHLIDIHSQHQSLLIGQPEYQINILDAYCGNRELIEVYREQYRVRNSIIAGLRALKERAADAEKEADYLNFQFNQLENTRLKEGEKEELEEELALLSNAESVKSIFTRLTEHLRDMDQAVIPVLKSSKNDLSTLRTVVKEAEEYEGRLHSVILELNDMADEAEKRAERVEYNPVRIETINNRLSVIYDLLYKYRVEKVMDLIILRDQIADKLKGIQGYSEEIESLAGKLKATEEKMSGFAQQLHQARVGAEGKLSEDMRKLLVDLGIKHAEFIVSITGLPEFTATGCDEVKFLFAANKNQQPGEIFKVASGGEISRVMLSLKYVLSKTKQLPVIVFDEIDTGLSGEVAHKMAEMMTEMALRMQVISISHLPQIAAAGSCHFKVYKEDNQSHTISRIRKLDDEERVKEIAGMISGREITTSALETARGLMNIVH